MKRHILAISPFPPIISGGSKGTYEFFKRKPSNLKISLINYAQTTLSWNNFKVYSTGSKIATNIFQGIKHILVGIILGIRICKEDKPDLIYTKNLSSPSIIGFFLSFLFRIPLILHSSGTDLIDQNLHTKNWGMKGKILNIILLTFNRVFLRYSNKIIANCYADYRKILWFNPKYKNKTKIVYNGIDTSKYSPEVELNEPIELKTRSNTKKRIILIGRDIPQKNYDLLLPTCEKNPDISFIICGRKPKQNDPENLISLTMVDDVRPYLKYSDLFLSISKAEGVSNALLEAMAMEKPVLVSNVGDNGYLVGRSNAGEVLGEITQEEIERKIIEMFDSNMTSFAKNSRHYSLKYHNWNKQSNEFYDYILSDS